MNTIAVIFRSARNPFFMLVSVLIFCTPQAGQNGRPSRGSIEFGAEKPPVELDSQGIGPFRDAFVKVAQKVVPSVVSVLPTRIDTVLFYRNPFYRDPFGFGPDEEQPQQRRRKVQGLGSGVIVSKKGYILTNYHVVAGAEEIEIMLSDNRVFPATIAGQDSLSDVAVIKIKGKIPSDLPVAYLGNSERLEVGAWVAAIGNPFSLTSTITSGIVSALGRRVGAELTYQNFIQTDAAINPGNSGGALVTVDGAVVGINTLIFSETGGFMGIGFAIPVNMARRVMEDLIYEGRVIRGYAGVSVQEITPQIQKGLNLESSQGALVVDVPPGQPASKAGFNPGDVIVAVGDRKVESANDLTNIIASLKPQKEVVVTIIRNGKTMTLKLTPADRATEQTAETPTKQQPHPQRDEVGNKTGIGVENLTDEIRSQLDIPQGVKGVVVISISPEVTDSRTMLRQGDVIVRVKTGQQQWDPISDKQMFYDFAKKLKKGQSVILQVQRQQHSFIVAFDVL
ncbi:MAG TPA: Do family serine endopeptidase [Chitinispirillaceae bacterium]|nr:Do family serine endopeptidase [Chitinispirillaceae bacterium]